MQNASSFARMLQDERSRACNAKNFMHAKTAAAKSDGAARRPNRYACFRLPARRIFPILTQE